MEIELKCDIILTTDPSPSRLVCLTNSHSFCQSTTDPTPETIATAIKIAVPSIQAKQIIINFIYSRLEGENCFERPSDALTDRLGELKRAQT